jgi:hypothetical protein
MKLISAEADQALREPLPDMCAMTKQGSFAHAPRSLVPRAATPREPMNLSCRTGGLTRGFA